MADISQPTPGKFDWRLSAHPITFVTFLAFRAGMFLSELCLDERSTLPNEYLLPAGPLTYLFGVLFTDNFVLIFITTILLLAADFYYLKNIAGRRLVGLRWWNEANPSTGDSHWVFESAPQPNEPGGKVVTPTDKRFFWIALYAQPAFWAALAIVAIVRFKFIWLTLVGMLRSS